MRIEIKKTLADMPTIVAAEKSLRACEKLSALPEFKKARTVMLYMPIAGEVDCTHVALHAWRDGKNVVLPKVSWEQRHMIAVTCDSFDDEFEQDTYGLRHPADSQPCPEEDIDFIVVPALAYDRNGHRLGRGGGFYDRFLAQGHLNAVKCGLAFEEQLVDDLPVHEHDQPVCILVTDEQVLRFNRKMQK